MRAGLAIDLSQKMGITPKLTQSLKVLAMGQMELEGFLDEMLLTNPLLENKTPAPDDVSLEDIAEAPAARREVADGDSRWEDYYFSGHHARAAGELDQVSDMVDEVSLTQRLLEQLELQPMSAADRAIARVIVNALDEDGFFRADIDEMAHMLRVDVQQVQHVLETYVHQLEPAGIGARSTLECFLLQLDGSTDEDDLAREILLHYADNISLEDEQMAALLGRSVQQVASARARLKRLDPFPGHEMRSEQLYIRPDIVFSKGEKGELTAEVIDHFSNRLEYVNRWKGVRWNDKDKNFMKHAMQEAKWLLSAINQRMTTMEKVALCLLERQKNYLLYGPLGLQPLTLMDVANDIGMHESTVCRAISGKYAKTPIGLVELKSFFSAGLATKNGGMVSVRKVQEHIRMFISTEPPHKPISDQAIADRLAMQGIVVARRTVAKYRESMGILPTSKRRRRR